MKKRVFGKASLLLSVCLAVALCAFAPDRAEADLTVTLVNKTDATVSVALAWVSEGGENDGDRSKGWWNVEPDAKRTITVDYSPVCGYFWYARSLGGKRSWAAKDGNAFWIHPEKSFETHPDKPICGGRRLYFRPLDVKSKEGSATATLTFAVK